jgi:predicted DNA-binding transcriptional regulator AlpA
VTSATDSPQRRGLPLKDAAAYVGCGRLLFAKLVAEGRAPSPYMLGDVRRWDIRELDSFIDRLPRARSGSARRAGDQ